MKILPRYFCTICQGGISTTDPNFSKPGLWSKRAKAFVETHGHDPAIKRLKENEKQS